MKTIARVLRNAFVCTLCLLLQLQNALAATTKTYSIGYTSGQLYTASVPCGSTTTDWGYNCYCGNPERYNGRIGAVATWTFQDIPPSNNSPAQQISVSLPTGAAAGGGFDIRLNGSLLGTITTAGGYCGGISFGTLDAFVNNYNTGGINTITFTRTTADNMSFLSGNFSATVTYSASTPAASGFTNSVIPLISWLPLTGATSYQLQIDGTPFFDGTGLINKNPILDTTYYILNNISPEVLSNGQTYYTRFRALGGPWETKWSPISDFTVDTTPPPAPTLTSPADQSTSATETPTLNWSPVTSGTE